MSGLTCLCARTSGLRSSPTRCPSTRIFRRRSSRQQTEIWRRQRWRKRRKSVDDSNVNDISLTDLEQQLQNSFYNLLREKKGKKTKVIDLTTQKRPGRLHRYQGYQHLHHSSKLKEKIREGIRSLQARFRGEPTGRGDSKGHIPMWGNAQAARDIQNETRRCRRRLTITFGGITLGS